MPQLIRSVYIRWWDRFATPIQIPNLHLPSSPSALSPSSPSIAVAPPPTLAQSPPCSLLAQQEKIAKEKGKAPLVSEPNPVSSPSPFTPPERFFANQFALLQAIRANDELLERDNDFFEDSQDPYDYSPLHLEDIFPLSEARPLIFNSPPTVPITMGPTTGPTAGPTLGPTAGPTVVPTADPTVVPTLGPTVAPTVVPTPAPLLAPPSGGSPGSGPPHVTPDVN